MKIFLIGVLALLTSTRTWGYVYSGVDSNSVAAWQPGNIAMQIKLGTGTSPLQDGTNYSTSVEAAMTAWNGQLGTVQFAPTTVAQSNSTDADHKVSEIVFSANVEGQDFGANVLAITVSYSKASIHERTEADIFFNTVYTWDSYRGPLQTPMDIRRVALHELGHVLGLGHPDLSGQSSSIPAIMSSTVSSIDALQADDIAGAQSLYRAPGQIAAPANDNFANATAITLNGSNSAQVTGTTYYATRESGEPQYGDDAGIHSAWWKWTATGSGSMTITTQGSYFDTELGVYTGSAVSALTFVASNDQATSEVSYSTVTFNVTSGTTYMIAVAGYANESGFVSLVLNYAPPAIAPTLTVQPGNKTVTVPQTATFSVTAIGTPSPSYQWQRLPAGTGTWLTLSEGGNYVGVTSSTLSVTAAIVAMNGDKFRCVASNQVGSATSNAAILTVIGLNGVVFSSAGGNYSLFVRSDGTLWATGDDTWGQLADGSISARNSPAQVATSVVSATAGNGETMIVGLDGTLKTVGLNVSGELGDGTLADRNNPVFVATSVLWTAAGGWHSLIIKSDGSLWGMGRNSSGQLGDGTKSNRPFPVKISTEVIAAAVGDTHSLFIKSDGSMWGMGDNSSYQLGEGAGVYVDPKLIATGVVAIAAGAWHSLFIKTDGSLWAMGDNSSGQLGDGTQTDRASPVQIATGVVAVAAGFQHSLFVKSDGTLWTMGRNLYGELGDGTGTDRLSPVQITTGVVSVSSHSSSEHSLFVKSDGSLWGMGNNNSGQLGDGTSSSHFSPVIISAGELVTPGAPTGLVVTNGTATFGTRLNWSPKSGAVKYEVWRSTTNNPASAVRIANNVSIPLFYDLGALSGTGYYYWVKAVNSSGASSLSSGAFGGRALGVVDFNGDGNADILWQNKTTGQRSVWYLNGSTLLGGENLWNVDPAWGIAAIVDLNGDGKADLLWQNRTTGQRSVWYLNGTTFLGGEDLWNVDPEWDIAAAVDLNGDGKVDLLWQNTTTGQRSVWYLNGTTLLGGENLWNVDPAWDIAAAVDLNNDGKADLLWQNKVNGQRSVWYLNGTVRLGGDNLWVVDPAWDIASTVDLNGDGKADLLWQNKLNGQRSVWYLNGTTFLDGANLWVVDPAWDIAK